MGYRLYDYESSTDLGEATPAQVAASFSPHAGDEGVILINADGDVIAVGSWDAEQDGVRTVYVGEA